jgi:hypothetical protein
MNRTLAHILSFLGHPLLMLSYALLLLLALNPYAFSVRGMGDHRAVLLLLTVFVTTFLLPGFGVALLKPLGFIRSLEMHDKQERIGPYIITGVFYLWLFKNLNGSQAPALFGVFVLGATIGLFFAFFFNIFTKISAHATGMGGLVAMVLLAVLQWQGMGLALPLPLGGSILLSSVAVLALTVLLAGMVGSARLALGAHVPADLYRGYAAGFVAVLIAQALIG